MNYEAIDITPFRAQKEIFDHFREDITSKWADEYITAFPKHEEITLQNFFGFAFLIDHIWPDEEAADVNKELPETRVISFFGISNTSIDPTNRRRMRSGWGKTSVAFSLFGENYDKGHFIAHGFGGPVDVNIFPQRRDINRGWSDKGKQYRRMESYVAANPGTFVFSRPLYTDFSICPDLLEYGYYDENFNLHFAVFPNRGKAQNEILIAK
jgi:hypothetical protein